MYELLKINDSLFDQYCDLDNYSNVEVKTELLYEWYLRNVPCYYL